MKGPAEPPRWWEILIVFLVVDLLIFCLGKWVDFIAPAGWP